MSGGPPQNDPSEWYSLAVDFGTSNTCAAVLRPGADPVPLRLGYSSNSMPSAVLVQGDRVALGDDALRMAALHPSGLERTPKRRLGEPTILLDGRECRPTNLVAAVLRRVLSTAAQQSRGTAPGGVVITHPAAWGNHLLGKLREAATLAGLDPDRVELVPEPLAAAWRHAEGAGVAPGEELAVADLGGGTFDVACLSAEAGPQGLRLRVGTVDGIDPLGGDDFDEQIERWVRDQLVSEGRQDLLQQLDSPEGLASRLTLREEITRAKHDLSYHASAPLAVVVGAERLVLTLSITEFEQMIRPAVARTVEVTRSLLGERGVQHLFLTGGTSLIPLVQREFQELTGGRVGTLGDPKEVTSVGALIASERVRRPPVAETSTAPAPPDPAPARGRRWGPWAAAAAIFLGLLVGGGGVWAWAAGEVPRSTQTQTGDGVTTAKDTSRTDKTPGKRPSTTPSTGPVERETTPSPETPASPSEGAGKETTADAPPGDEPVTPQDAVTPGCWGLSSPECDLVTSLSELAEEGSCSSVEVTSPVRHGVRCTPRTTSVALTGTALYLYSTDAVGDSENVISTFLRRNQIDVDTQGRSDVQVPPAWNRWQNQQGEVRGTIYSYVEGGAAHLLWTYEQDSIHVDLTSTGGDVTNLYGWWVATGTS